MTVTVGSAVPSSDEIISITHDVWSSFLSAETLDVGGELPPGDARVTACVTVSGAWNGAILLECGSDAARDAAAALFMAEPAEMSDPDIADALGELVNMVGGNVKGLLPGPSKLSVPSVTYGAGYVVHVPGSVPVVSATVSWGHRPVRVSVWSV